MTTQHSSPRPDAASNARKRVRSTTGCSNCKRRKLKCDEKKPGCLRCHTKGLQCPGYPSKGLRWSSKHELHAPRRSPIVSEHEAEDEHETEDGSASGGYGTSPTAFGSASTTPARAHLANACLDDNTNAHYLTSHPFAASFALQCGPCIFESAPESYELGPTAASPEPFVGEKAAVSPSHPNRQCIFRQLEPDHRGKGTITDIASISPVRDQSSNGTEHFLGTESTAASTLSLLSKTTEHPLTTVSPSLIHIPTLLVEYYFQKVCRDCSTFDSPLNPFRGMISNMRNTSPSINYVIQSLSASKLADDIPHMKLVGLEARDQALQTVNNECLRATALHDVSDEVLCALLLLGMTTSWHVREDLGLEYLALAGRVITARAEAPDASAQSNLGFFRNALKYWKMVASLVSGAVETPYSCDQSSLATFGPSLSFSHMAKILPHPWTGVSAESQDLFGQVLRLIRKTRAGTGKSNASAFSRAEVNNISSAIASAEILETKCWRISLPKIEDIEDTGDPSTPPLHHVLTAKAYLLAALLHIYMIFPDVLEYQTRSFLASGSAISIAGATPSACTISWSWLWGQRSAADPHSAWLRDIGLGIVECLENIGVQSSTRAVHPPLLLSVASALTLRQEDDGLSKSNADCEEASASPSSPPERHTGTMRHAPADGTNHRVRHCRSFIISRLEIMQALMRFHAIDNILTVIKEVWKRTDAGAPNTFWMDIMSELHCESLFG